MSLYACNVHDWAKKSISLPQCVLIMFYDYNIKIWILQTIVLEMKHVFPYRNIFTFFNEFILVPLSVISYDATLCLASSVL